MQNLSSSVARPTFRFAPSPNGRLHQGHALSALLNARLAERLDGRFLIRLEDIDTIRCTDELAAHCLADLSWLGLRWEVPVRVQSRHFADYAMALAVLRTQGLIYPCFCSRKSIAEVSTAHDPDGAPLYPGICAGIAKKEAGARIAAGEAHAWRLRMTQAIAQAGSRQLRYTRFVLPSFSEETVEAHPARWGDVILARKETPASYHLSVVVDDALQGVTHVVRGADIEASTCVHVLLQKLLQLPTPFYHHHALLTDAEGEKLSKSKGCESIAELRAKGLSAAEIITGLRSAFPF